jgi:hypothetical protein
MTEPTPAEQPGYNARVWETYRRDAGCGCTAPDPTDCAEDHSPLPGVRPETQWAFICVCHRLARLDTPATHAPCPQDGPGAVGAVSGMPEAENAPQTSADGFGLRASVQQVLAELRTRLVAQHKGAMAASAASSGDAALVHDGSRMGLDVAVAELDALALRLAEGRSGAPDRS